MAHDKSFKPTHIQTQRVASGVHFLLFSEAGRGKERERGMLVSIVVQTLQLTLTL